MNENYYNLVAAIVLQAVKDYRKVLRTLSRHPHHRLAQHESRNLERFFCCSWFGILTDIDPEMLITKLKAEVKA